MTLTTEELITTIKSLESTANFEPDSVPHSARPGFQMAADEAKRQLAALKPEYRQRMMANSVAFVVSGPKASEYAAIAAKTAPSLFKLEVDELYKSLADKIEPTIGDSRTFSTVQWAGLMALLRQTARENGSTTSINFPLNVDDAVCLTKADVEAHVARLSRESAGAELAARYLGNKLISHAIETSFSGSVLGAVVINLSGDPMEQELGQIFATRIDVPTDEDTEIDEEFVIKTFEMAKKTKSKKQSNAKNTKEHD